jgi:AcrR family transcriptional regulator
LSIQKSKPTPRQILEVAARLFSERGYSNVSIRDICREARTTPPMIYYYFGDKKGLFHAVTKSRITMKEFIQQLRDTASNSNVEKMIESFVRVYLSSFPEEAFKVGLYLKDSATLDRENATKIAAGFDEIRRILTGIVSVGMEKGVLRRADPALSADALMGLLNHVIFQRIHFERGFDLDASVSYLVDFFMRAMSASGTGQPRRR